MDRIFAGKRETFTKRTLCKFFKLFTFVAVKSPRFDFNVFMTGSVLDLLHSTSLTVQLLLRGSDLREAVLTSLMQVYARNQSSEHNKQVVCLIFTKVFLFVVFDVRRSSFLCEVSF